VLCCVAPPVCMPPPPGLCTGVVTDDDQAQRHHWLRGRNKLLCYANTLGIRQHTHTHTHCFNVMQWQARSRGRHVLLTQSIPHTGSGLQSLPCCPGCSSWLSCWDLLLLVAHLYLLTSVELGRGHWWLCVAPSLGCEQRGPRGQHAQFHRPLWSLPLHLVCASAGWTFSEL
jgi:hypothetical protein